MENNNNSSNSLVFGRWPQTKILEQCNSVKTDVNGPKRFGAGTEKRN